uniref:Uncharacterized protein n=1 Tax=Rhizophagus irregularis (strain DAOM 181602 / DAOM 197198 / MUCL 43194) TaxID=747089 RepID=U9U8Y8_RHIID
MTEGGIRHVNMLQDKAQMFNLNTSEMRLRGETWRLQTLFGNILDFERGLLFNKNGEHLDLGNLKFGLIWSSINISKILYIEKVARRRKATHFCISIQKFCPRTSKYAYIHDSSVYKI